MNKQVYVIMVGAEPIACLSNEPTDAELSGYAKDNPIVVKLPLGVLPGTRTDSDWIDMLEDVDKAAAYILRGWLTEDVKLFSLSKSRRVSGWLHCRFRWDEAPLGYKYWRSVYHKLENAGL